MAKEMANTTKRWRTRPSQHVAQIKRSTNYSQMLFNDTCSHLVQIEVGFMITTTEIDCFQDDEENDPTYMPNQSREHARPQKAKVKAVLSESDQTRLENLQKYVALNCCLLVDALIG